MGRILLRRRRQRSKEWIFGREWLFEVGALLLFLLLLMLLGLGVEGLLLLVVSLFQPLYFIFFVCLFGKNTVSTIKTAALLLLSCFNSRLGKFAESVSDGGSAVFLSAAKPSGQGEESVVVLVVVFSNHPTTVFWGAQNFVLKWTWIGRSSFKTGV